MKKLVAKLFVTLVFAGLLSVCAESSVLRAYGAEKPVRIAFMVNKLSSAFWRDVEQGAKDASAELGYEINILCPTTPDSNEEQIQLLEQSLINPPTIFVITPADANGITPAIEMINEAGIPIVNYNSRFLDKSVECLTFVGVDKYELAKQAAEALIEKLNGKGKVLMLEGVTGSQTSIDIKNGALEALRAVPGIELLDSQPANYLRTDGLSVTQNLLQKYPEVDAIFAANAESAMGAAEAIRQSGRKDIKIATLNMSDEVAQAILNGVLAVVVDDVPYDVGRNCVLTVQDYLGGKDIPKDVMLNGVLVELDSIDPYVGKYGLKK
ncbi:MAG: sugar ABC transporter substrate-binding protein [Synergistaceae bacterium]|jgi:ABC-type sugar transport system substrate-binding protein|nr:sugar ABC transporter substrate-binding protein [Synergistaceae bacterium]